MDRRLVSEHQSKIDVTCAGDALTLIRLLKGKLGSQRKVRGSLLDVLSLWILQREAEIDDIKHGAKNLLEQAVEAVGEITRREQ